MKHIKSLKQDENMLLKEDGVRKKRPERAFRAVIEHLNWTKYRPQRAGVIPYIVYEDKLLFAFGLDSKFRELTDFGGGISYKKDKTAVVGALRELKEESLGIFGDLKPKDLEKSFVVYNLEMMIVFYPIEADRKEKNNLFHERLKVEKNPEVCDIVWLNEEELRGSLDPKSRLIYLRVRHLLVGAGNFYDFLRNP